MVTLREALNDHSRRHIVSLSGGKDSAALLVYLVQHYPELPLEAVFCDTGTELPETYDYLERIEHVLGVRITRITALDVLGIQEKQGRIPFDVVLSEIYGNFLPSPNARWCTRALKIKPFEHYIGNDTAYTYIGLRADEDRVGYVGKKPPVFSEKPNILPVYPFRDDGLTLTDIKNLLHRSGLGLPDYYQWRSRSGCYFCFYQQIGEWQGLKERHPELFEKAKAYEKDENGRRYTWVQGRSLEDLERLRRRYSVPSEEDGDGCAICHL